MVDCNCCVIETIIVMDVWTKTWWWTPYILTDFSHGENKSVLIVWLHGLLILWQIFHMESKLDFIREKKKDCIREKKVRVYLSPWEPWFSLWDLGTIVSPWESQNLYSLHRMWFKKLVIVVRHIRNILLLRKTLVVTCQMYYPLSKRRTLLILIKHAWW